MTRYWLRFDDLCPTMNRRKWERAEQLLDAHRACPLLAVVPDNRDPVLQVDDPDPEFWNRARDWQQRGWVIGLHGYQHRYDSRAPSILPFKAVSEFSGHPIEIQAERIEKGLTILRREGLDPRVWVAPGHAFDDVTLQVLDDAGIRFVSDGFGFRPYRDQRGLIWLPQQSRRPRRFPFGTITLAFHTNEMDDDAFDKLDRFLDANDDRLVREFDALLENVSGQTWVDRAWESALSTLFRWKWRHRIRSA